MTDKPSFMHEDAHGENVTVHPNTKVIITSDSGCDLPTGPKLTEFLRAVADDTHVVIPVADLPEVEVEEGHVNGGGPWFQAPSVGSLLNDRARVLEEIRDSVAVLRAMDAHEAEQADEGEAKVEELAGRMYESARAAFGPDTRAEPWDVVTITGRKSWLASAREAIAWHEEQEGQG